MGARHRSTQPGHRRRRRHRWRRGRCRQRPHRPRWRETPTATASPISPRSSTASTPPTPTPTATGSPMATSSRPGRTRPRRTRTATALRTGPRTRTTTASPPSRSRHAVTRLPAPAAVGRRRLGGVGPDASGDSRQGCRRRRLGLRGRPRIRLVGGSQGGLRRPGRRLPGAGPGRGHAPDLPPVRADPRRRRPLPPGRLQPDERRRRHHAGRGPGHGRAARSSATCLAGRRSSSIPTSSRSVSG